MGIIKAAGAAASGMWEDQWKEVFWCDAMASGDMLVRGRKRTSSNSANHGDDSVITDGSIIIVNEGQCAIVVDNGRVIAAYTEPGEHVFHGKRGMKNLLKEFGKRVSYGGDAPYSNMRIYYVNLHESANHPFSVSVPVKYATEGAGITAPLTISGFYCCKVTDPTLFYQKITGNVENRFHFATFTTQMDHVFRDQFPSAVTAVCGKGIRIDQLGMHTKELCKNMQASMRSEEVAQCGITISDIRITAIGSNAMGRTQRREDLTWMAGGSGDAPAEQEGGSAPKSSNTNLQTGALSSSLGNSHLRYTPPQQRSFRVYPAAHLPGIAAPEQPAPAPEPTPTPEPEPAPAPAPEPLPVPDPVPVQEAVQVPLWVCSCGAENTTRFCTECGKMRAWQCLCGHISQDSICEHCGAPMQE